MIVLIKGAGDLATGVAVRLRQCGFEVVMTETARPTTVRCTVAFSRAVYKKTAEVEGVKAVLCAGMGEVSAALARGEAAVVVDPRAEIITALRPNALIDAIIAKKNLGTGKSDAPAVVALGPGFTAGVDCHAVVETRRGHNLGRVFYSGRAEENTGVPGNIGGYTNERILRACRDGVFTPLAEIGDMVRAGDVVATVGGEAVRTEIEGVVRGMLPAGTPVCRGMKSGDVDPRGILEYCYSISDKARAIAGGALEAVLHLTNGRNLHE